MTLQQTIFTFKKNKRELKIKTAKQSKSKLIYTFNKNKRALKIKTAKQSKSKLTYVYAVGSALSCVEGTAVQCHGIFE